MSHPTKALPILPPMSPAMIAAIIKDIKPPKYNILNPKLEIDEK